MILKTFPNIQELVGNSLYISVSVLTEGGSEMVAAQKGGIYIVMSPYTIYFKKTPKFFKPGMPFDVKVYVTKPDQTPAKGVDVVAHPGGQPGRTKANGFAKVTVNTQGTDKSLKVTVKTSDPGIADHRQEVKEMIAQAYTPKAGSSNYLHIGISAEGLQLGENVKVYLNFYKSPGVQNQDITYLILSKGQIVQAKRFKRQGQSFVTLSLPVTKDMIPSFRVVAYYHVKSSEVVSDSIWVDVKDTCMETLKVEVKDPKSTYQPGELFGLKITGDPGAIVGLVAVDKGVFVLNKNRLTQDKIWSIIEKHDTGCTAGSGKDSMGVFYDAGLLFESDKAGGTETRTTPDCPTAPSRRRRAHTVLRISRTLGEEDDDMYESSDQITSGTLFRESWLWEHWVLPDCQENPCDTTTLSLNKLHLEDSITTWQILAVSLSKTHGICVADPYEMIVKNDISLDLKLPYSAVRYEQLEIKAILHNFSNKKHKVRVEFIEVDHVCSAASKKGKYRTTVDVEAMSSRSISYIIIPMELGNHWIEVKAAVYGSVLADGVRKVLKVVSEGVLTTIEEMNVELNPSEFPGGVQTVHVKSDIPEGQIPHTPAHTFITVSGQEVIQTIEQAISGDFMGRLIVQPLGSGEQNMIFMTLPLIATHYLDTTKQWEAVGIQRREEAVRYLKTGYERQLTFRKHDGSFAVWTTHASSTWLTAYVAKVFAMASDIITIREDVLCSALKWLVLNKQVPDGMFREDAPVFQGEMIGDVRGKDAETSLTAFILIAMQEANELCIRSVPSLPESMKKAIGFLDLKMPTLTNPYAVAMTSYAMANAGKFDKELLMKFSSGDGAYWLHPRNHQFSLEASAYALLALVKVKDFEAAGKVVHWLNRQTNPYGSNGTTQSTIMVFQSVAEYYKQVKRLQSMDLEVVVSVSGQNRPKKWLFRRDSLHLTRSDKIQLQQECNVTAKGSGVGSLKVQTLYYAQPTEKESDCKIFDLIVKMERQQEASYPAASESYWLTIEIFYKSQTRDATISILDIGLLTGFLVDERDLTDLITGTDRYVQRFEMDKQLSERGSLILYLSKVSRGEVNKISFRMHKIYDVSMLQPGAITVYEYYSPEERCVKFYHPQKKNGALTRLCDKDGLCYCAEENCSLQKKRKFEEKDREKKACDMNYVYKVKVVKTDLSPNTDYYTMKIEQVLKKGTDAVVEGQERSFMGHSNCRESFAFEDGKSYLIMGQSAVLPKKGGRPQYILGEKTWIEYWPTSMEGQTQEYKEKYVGITGLAVNLMIYGCFTSSETDTN
ncbi:complement C3-like isoform X2 [Hoplias malabaricus]